MITIHLQDRTGDLLPPSLWSRVRYPQPQGPQSMLFKVGRQNQGQANQGQTDKPARLSEETKTLASVSPTHSEESLEVNAEFSQL